MPGYLKVDQIWFAILPAKNVFPLFEVNVCNVAGMQAIEQHIQPGEKRFIDGVVLGKRSSLNVFVDDASLAVSAVEPWNPFETLGEPIQASLMTG